jgi:hypothetical protein
MNTKSTWILSFLVFACLAALASAGTISIPLVTVGDPRNVVDPTTGYGAVPYVYEIGEYDVTTAQYTAFLNAVATAGDPYGLYSTGMGTDLHAVGITLSSSGAALYAVNGNGNVPVLDVSWGDAARFVSWLANGRPTGPEGTHTTEAGSYTLDGARTNTALSARLQTLSKPPYVITPGELP